MIHILPISKQMPGATHNDETGSIANWIAQYPRMQYQERRTETKIGNEKTRLICSLETFVDNEEFLHCSLQLTNRYLRDPSFLPSLFMAKSLPQNNVKKW